MLFRSLGLVAWEELGDAQYPYVVERRKADMMPIATKGMPYTLNAHPDCIKVGLNVTYEQAEAVLSRLRDLLNPDAKT